MPLTFFQQLAMRTLSGEAGEGAEQNVAQNGSACAINVECVDDQQGSKDGRKLSYAQICFSSDCFIIPLGTGDELTICIKICMQTYATVLWCGLPEWMSLGILDVVMEEVLRWITYFYKMRIYNRLFGDSWHHYNLANICIPWTIAFRW